MPKMADSTGTTLSIAALQEGFKVIEELKMERISAHVRSLRERMVTKLKSLKHANMKPMVQIYGEDLIDGSIITLNFLNLTGEFVRHEKVLEKARANKFMIQGGCFSNQGGCERAAKRVLAEYDWPYEKPFGALRISLGAYANQTNIDEFVTFVTEELFPRRPRWN
jgi:selenocysteine lyase/cysteine desulfurase